MKQTSSIIFIFALTVIVTVSCTKSSDYYHRMKALALDIEKYPSDSDSWNKLLGHLNSERFWEREFAFQFLVSIASTQKNNELRREQMIEIFRSGLSDSDLGTQKLSANGVKEIGVPAINRSSRELADLVQSGVETNSVWTAAELLGEITDQRHIETAFEALISGISSEPPSETQRAAPQVRVYALESAKKLAKTGKVTNAIERLESVFPEVSGWWREEVRAAVEEVR